jgi:ABC-2 type transport system permease protein
MCSSGPSGGGTDPLPIYEQSYRRYQAREPLKGIRFWPIAREALRHILAKRAFLILLIVSWLPFLVRVGQIVAVRQFPQFRLVLPVDGTLFGEFLNQQVVFTLLLSVFGGAGLIANDLRTGAILVYLSRPLTRRDYVLGKLTVLLALNLAVTLVPGLLLYAAALALAPETFATWSLAWIAPAIVAQSLLVSLGAGLVTLAISSVSRSARVAGLTFVLLWVGLAVVGNVLESVVNAPAAALLSLQADVTLVGNALFGIATENVVHWSWAALVLALVVAACVLVLRSRVRAVEVVA